MLKKRVFGVAAPLVARRTRLNFVSSNVNPRHAWTFRSSLIVTARYCSPSISTAAERAEEESLWNAPNTPKNGAPKTQTWADKELARLATPGAFVKEVERLEEVARKAAERAHPKAVERAFESVGLGEAYHVDKNKKQRGFGKGYVNYRKRLAQLPKIKEKVVSRTGDEAKSFRFSRYMNIALASSVPLAVIAPVTPFPEALEMVINYALVGLIPYHLHHYGRHIVKDYVGRGLAYLISRVLLLLATIGTIVGLFKINRKEGGILKVVKDLWV